MRKTKAQNGITLISLVITIIVLLILATVAISMAVDSNGLFKRAEYATETWNASVKNESEAMEGLLTTLNELVPMEPEEEGTKLIDLYKAGELKIGDYIDYNPIAEGDTGEEEKYTYISYGTKNGMGTGTEAGIRLMASSSPAPDTDETGNQKYKANTNIKWRILGTEGEGANEHLLLISEKPVAKDSPNENEYFWMYGAKGYLNCIDELNNISKIYGYGAGAQGARSININDINKISGVTVDEENYTITPDGVDEDGQYGDSYSYDNQYTPENWKGSTQASTPETVAGRSTDYYYSGDNEQLQTSTEKNPETGNELYSMIYGNGSFIYWLASRGVYDYSSYVNFGPGGVSYGFACSHGGYLFYSNGDENYFYAGVRPVVSLKSSVTDSTLHKVNWVE